MNGKWVVAGVRHRHPSTRIRRAGVPRRNLIGLEVGDLKVVGHWFAETWACRCCSCGREALVHADDLVRAQMRSCGCKPGTRRPQRRPGFPNAPRAKRL
jgi:hypothetical protein